MHIRGRKTHKYFLGALAVIVLIFLCIFTNWVTAPHTLLNGPELSPPLTSVDEKSPIVELLGNNPDFFCKGQAYREPGYTAIDDIDGNITKNVKKTIRTNKIVYSVADSSGNKTSVSRGLQPYLENLPSLELVGGNVQIYVGANYAEPGYKASDICDGNLAAKVEVENTININQAGLYMLKYTVKNSNGKTAIAERTVEVKPRPTGNGIIYLTFDDGPSKLTTQVLDILKSENVKATFFVVGSASSLNSIVRRAHQEGHTIAAHSNTHNYSQIYASETAFFNDLNAIENKIAAITGKRTPFIRFPGGSSNTVSKFNPGIMTRLAGKVKAQGYTYFDWNVSSGDAGITTSASGVYRNVTSGLSASRSNIVLMHDSADKTYTVAALRDIIRFGKNHGYQFAPITASTAPITHRINN